MIDAKPYTLYDNPWDGDGPSMGAGADLSDPRYGGVADLVAVGFSLQYQHTLVPPKPNTYIDFMGMGLYPTDDVEAATPVNVLTSKAIYDYQDIEPGGQVGADLDPQLTLQAPSIPVGGTNLRGM